MRDASLSSVAYVRVAATLGGYLTCAFASKWQAIVALDGSGVTHIYAYIPRIPDVLVVWFDD